MKKIIIFLMLTCAVFLSNNFNVYAEEKQFYESNYINMYLKRHHSSNLDLAYYQMARIYREKATDEEVFCIQPEIGTDENAIYYKNSPTYLSNNQKEMIKLLSYFGFMYPNHNTARWYMVTQLLIWRTVDPNGLYYFTDTLNGYETNKYDKEINELYSLINNYVTVPNIAIPKAIKANTRIELIDKNNILSNYKTDIGVISGNKLIINDLPVGEYTINLTRTFNKTGKEGGFYSSNTSQDMFLREDINDIKIPLKIKVINTSIKINKKDKDNINYNNASLKGTKFALINDKTKEEKELVIDEKNSAYIENLDFGTYTLKEIESGKGYKLNNKEYKIVIDENTPNIELDIENEVIKKYITIHKTYGEHDFKNESNITFNIYNNNNELVDTVRTNENGYVYFTLPYGKYKLIQINSTEGYQKISPFEINVEDEELLYIELKDYKINVPNTYKKASLISIILKFLFIV